MELNFNDALRFVLEVEGGYSDDPDDKGGRTNYGITQATYDEWLARHKMPAAEVSSLAANYAEAIYFELFWTDGGCENLPSPLNVVHFDSLVNHGPGNAAALLGWATWAPDQPGDREAYALLCLRNRFYQKIAEAKPNQAKFLRGWRDRLDRLRTFVGL